MVNQNTPTGSLTYNQIGKFADGTPRYEAVTALSPAEQYILHQQQETEKNIGDIGVSQSEKIFGLLNSPIKLGNEATEARLMELGSKRLDPMFAQRDDELQTQLMNRGIRPGTPAYENEMTRLSESRNDAYRQLLLHGRGMANQEMLTERNQPLNEISALMSGSQVSMPNFVGTPQTNVNGVDYAGLVGDKYKADMAGYQAGMGGLFGLGGSLASAFMMSDRRVKRDVRRVGTADNGTPIYLFRYAAPNSPLQMGVMAQDVIERDPAAVLDVNGILHVDLERALA